jgi:hypothetical protein
MTRERCRPALRLLSLRPGSLQVRGSRQHEPFDSWRERFIVRDTPATGPAPAGFSPAPGDQPDDRVLLILAADHHNNLDRDPYGLTASPASAQAVRWPATPKHASPRRSGT